MSVHAVHVSCSELVVEAAAVVASGLVAVAVDREAVAIAGASTESRTKPRSSFRQTRPDSSLAKV